MMDLAQVPAPATRSGHGFAAVTLGLSLLAWFLDGWVPVAFSIATVFLFAGPHNWIEARYFLGRLPARWGKLWTFFVLALGGVFGLTAAFAALPHLAAWGDWSGRRLAAAQGLWNTAFLVWLAVLVQLRSRQKPRRDWSWTFPVILAVAALSWIAPDYWGLALVYGHPLVALWILDRELGRRRQDWQRVYRCCLGLLPVLLGLLWWRLANAAPLPGDDGLTLRIARHAGAATLPGVSSHLLVATHTFLEMLHYGVWLLAIPLAGFGAAPWRVQPIALARRSLGWRRAVLTLLGLGGLLVLVLWGCFMVDYATTRDVYFTVAMLHVLAEVPFLLRVL
jgi:hypothetical protein